MSYIVSFCSCVFQSQRIAGNYFTFSVLSALRLHRLGRKELILELFVRFVLVWIYRFPLPLGVWEGLRFVIVALPGLFSYLFCDTEIDEGFLVHELTVLFAVLVAVFYHHLNKYRLIQFKLVICCQSECVIKMEGWRKQQIQQEVLFTINYAVSLFADEK